MNRWPAAIVALLIIASLAQGQAEADKRQALKAGDLTVKVPPDWEVVADEKSLLTVVTPQEGADDKFRENLRISATDAAAGATIDALFQASLRPIEKGESPLKLVGKGSLTANGHKVLWMSLRPRQPKPDQDALTMVEYGFVYGGKAYSFKAMAADAKLDKFKVEVEKILKAVEPKGGK
jgi:hypothetical protein